MVRSLNKLTPSKKALKHHTHRREQKYSSPKDFQKRGLCKLPVRQTPPKRGCSTGDFPSPPREKRALIFILTWHKPSCLPAPAPQVPVCAKRRVHLRKTPSLVVSSHVGVCGNTSVNLRAGQRKLQVWNDPSVWPEDASSLHPGSDPGPSEKRAVKLWGSWMLNQLNKNKNVRLCLCVYTKNLWR